MPTIEKLRGLNFKKKTGVNEEPQLDPFHFCKIGDSCFLVMMWVDHPSKQNRHNECLAG